MNIEQHRINEQHPLAVPDCPLETLVDLDWLELLKLHRDRTNLEEGTTDARC